LKLKEGALGALVSTCRWAAVLLLAAQSAWVFHGYYTPEDYEHLILMGELIRPRAKADEVVMMPSQWGDGSTVGYTAGLPIVQVYMIEDFLRVRNHPAFHGGYLVQLWNFDDTDGEELLASFEQVGTVEVDDESVVKVLYVPPVRTR
jgi:hypothetical protein